MKTKKKTAWGLLAALVTPVLLLALFYLLRNNQTAMDAWVFGVMAPAEQFWGRIWSIVPFSVMELMIALFLLGNMVWLIRAIVIFVKEKSLLLIAYRLAAVGAVWLWLWCGVCWLWNTAYSAASFTERSGLETTPYSVEELTRVTAYFAQNSARLADQVDRDEDGHFILDKDGFFDRGTKVYELLTREFPCLDMKAVAAKPLVCSRLQSIMGFTGMYFPFTGEANVNMDAPACLIPATIAHEMAHQRMVASELEANFVGIAACTTCSDVTFQYSGYLMGLIQLCNALYSVSPDTWYTIAQTYFTPELSTDWRDNNAYWAALASPVEDAAGQVYDSFLKGNGQELGMRSYGACVDLLVAYYGPSVER